MRLARLRLLPYRLPLPQAMQARMGDAELRAGTLISVDDIGGRCGWGDVVGWPGFGSDAAALQSALATLAPLVDDASLDDTVDALAGFAAAATAVPEVKAGLEQALLDLLAQHQGVPLYRLLGGTTCERLAIHSLVTNAAEAKAAQGAGARALKIKVGAHAVADDIARVASIRQSISAEVALRVDVNGAWDLATACAAAPLLAELGVDWLEQPVSGGARALAAVRRVAPVRIAADEAVTDASALAQLLAHEAVDGITLKPAVVGGLTSARRLAQQAMRAGLDVCVTHTFDSVVGRTGAIALAAALGLSGPHGLSAPFEEDLAGVYESRADEVSVPQLPGLGMTPRIAHSVVRVDSPELAL